ncbi:signal recognition particle-docking protein FtsY [Streptoalloteichus tenebrarius]|uniref:Signal recognition particle receptor FtsY n=1 Tax=Streptoalloteichus tenebrarius (strain ATCC 17920 / DSM 40477 / JCM 4838 / CBS 697.72 / NBRC 16177 / NCIMB 11028 / NRRL B-12390 / A12253. 1 / ISP 5477) TaxID=1933 RepID=A0ABT1HZC9_STRSD|nr:signal recognition particle-docking protein FtsY [Streptoalloteichus tenebrarius]MCP2260883.1 signal recognition particle-docking protein FtsY [Streptoalloteichus tenebrarius]BFF03357.1 signal recognition particle-docking protein FtsY [Streptoalloteichus tenebrarius]
MSTSTLIWIGAVVAAVLLVALVTGVVLARRRRIRLTAQQRPAAPRGGGYRAGGGISLSPGGPTATAAPPGTPPHPVEDRTEVDGQPGVGDDAAVPRDTPRRGIVDVTLPEGGAPTTEPTVEEVPAPRTEALPPTVKEAPAEAPPAPPVEETRVEEPVEAPAEPAPAVEIEVEPVPEAPAPEAGGVVEEIEPTAGRLERLRGRLSRSRGALGQGLLGLLGAGDLDEDSWTEIEDTLLMADLGAATTMEITEALRTEIAARGVRTPGQARQALRDVLVNALHPEMDRAVRALPHDGKPAVVLVVGVNGTGKTTTTGKLARVLVADGRQVLLGAADTFRAAAADQLATWAERVGAEVVRGNEGADPAAVAFDAVKRGVQTHVDAVLVDTAGRLHTKTGLMDELGKVKRVVEKQAEVDEVLLVLDATTGQNGLTQARVFSDVVDVTGIVLTKLDGTAKGGIVFQVQRELGVPVKLVGLGEGPDDLAPFEPAAFVDALLS